jgi:hypothetical protein
LFAAANTNLKRQVKKVSGHVQKGPFILGTAITLSELNSSLEQTGKNFNSQISDNSGSFEISNINLTSNYIELQANGYYFDEVKGEISPSQLSLQALADITNASTVNVNLLIHLEKQRVLFLVKQGKSFDEAKQTAQTDILSFFWIRDR